MQRDNPYVSFKYSFLSHTSIEKYGNEKGSNCIILFYVDTGCVSVTLLIE